jgi:putative restriction endonuclease
MCEIALQSRGFRRVRFVLVVFCVELTGGASDTAAPARAVTIAPPMPSLDHEVRAAAFVFLDQLQLAHRDGIPRDRLVKGFDFRGQRVALMGPKGIFKPALLPEVPISITTVPLVKGKQRPYDDEVRGDDLLHYRYRGTDPKHRDNVGLRRAMRQRIPLIYFYGVVEGLYLPVYPAFIVGDNESALTFTVAIDDRRLVGTSDVTVREDADDVRRRYMTAAVRVRLHQQAFRERVLQAYREHCAVCRLRHRVLLDAAHILPDLHPEGEPVVSNGLALCRLHHAAFDAHILGVRPDYVIEIRTDILDEVDGPMLVHGIQGFQGMRIQLPRHEHLRPDSRRLAERYETFRQAG